MVSAVTAGVRCWRSETAGAVANLNSRVQLETGDSLDLRPNFGWFVATRKHGQQRGAHPAEQLVLSQKIRSQVTAECTQDPVAGGVSSPPAGVGSALAGCVGTPPFEV